MTTKHFSLRLGEPKRLTISWGFGWKNFRVALDGREVGTIDGGLKALRLGRKFALEDGLNLLVQVAMTKTGFVGTTPELHLYLNGKPVPGSDAVPLPGWGYAFAAACAVIPLVARGGMLPGALGIGAAAACASVARSEQWSAGRRALACALITAGAWGAFLLFVCAVLNARGGP